MADLDLDALQALADAATPGRWLVRACDKHTVESGESCVKLRTPGGSPIGMAGDNLAFIAAARTALPSLIARVRELEAALVECEGPLRRVDSVSADRALRLIAAALGKEPRRHG